MSNDADDVAGKVVEVALETTAVVAKAALEVGVVVAKGVFIAGAVVFVLLLGKHR